MNTFSGKVAVVTGAGSGIGRALAHQLATKGARLALSDVNAAGLDGDPAVVAQGGSKPAAIRWTSRAARPSSPTPTTSSATSAPRTS